MKKKFLSIGIEMPGAVGEHIEFSSERSLFDGDVILFYPHFDDYMAVEDYAGKPLLTQEDSVQAAQDIKHWRSELEAAIQSGKVVFIYLAKPAEVYHYTGAKDFSGTGKNRASTVYVDALNSYDSLPINLTGMTPKSGKSIAEIAHMSAMSSYWSEFGSISAYQVHFSLGQGDDFLGTKGREKAVGTVIRKGSGVLVLLPPAEWDVDELTYTRGKKVYWRKSSVVLGNKLVNGLVAARKALKQEGEASPAPDWVARKSYMLPRSEAIKKEIATTETAIRKLNAKIVQKEALLRDSDSILNLLFETGRELERAILQALTILGFEAENYTDGQSEFDALFSSAEGNFLGEAEGKDKKAINVNKISQLERNIQEDFEREEVHEYAKGVLFGNAYRFTPVDERPDFFTEKCVTAAKRLKVALVRTPDLFSVCRFLIEADAPDFAAECRKKILHADGEIVQFPIVPKN